MQTAKAFMDQAQRQSGLSDFGPDSFREGLEVLTDSLSQEARLNELGEQFLSHRIVTHLTQRLQVEEWYRRHPEIDDEPIDKPLFGLSLPRTGSTALSFLLAEDPEIRYLRRWEAAQPCPPPGTVEGDDPRAVEERQKQQRAGLQSHTPSGGKEAAECQDLMALDFKSHIFQAFAYVPRYSAWLLDADLESTYRYQRRVLKLLQWQMPTRPWRLKCPTHLLFLDDLNKAFPDARFVMTHRDPAEVIPSVVDVYADILCRFTEHSDNDYLIELNLQHWSKGMERTLAFRDKGHEHRFYDIAFSDMQADPIVQVCGLYGWMGEAVSEAFREGMARWWQDNESQRQSRPNGLSPGQRYGIDVEAMRPYFAGYCQRFSG